MRWIRSGLQNTTIAFVSILTACIPAPDPSIDRSDPAPVGSSSTTSELQEDRTLDAEEVHSVHAPLGLPVGTPGSNDLIFRHSYTVSTNDATKFADWVAYAVRPAWVLDLSDPARNYRTDPLLDPDETLEGSPGAGDYTNAHSATGYDRGHLVPLASFRGSPFVHEVNLLSVLAPQVDSLNRGPWRSLESRVRRLVEDSSQTVYVLAGPVFADSSMPDLPGADETHVVPTHYWMLVYRPADDRAAGDSGDQLLLAAFIVPQRLPAYDGPAEFLVSVDEIEAATGLDLLVHLPDDVEPIAEAAIGSGWFETW